MFYPIKNPPKWMLNGLYKAMPKRGICPDCGTGSGKPHVDGCDVARCLNTGIQRLQCDCGKCGDDKWTGRWPGEQECYDNGWVVFDTASSSVMFDLNREAVERQTALQKRKQHAKTKV